MLCVVCCSLLRRYSENHLAKMKIEYLFPRSGIRNEQQWCMVFDYFSVFICLFSVYLRVLALKCYFFVILTILLQWMTNSRFLHSSFPAHHRHCLARTRVVSVNGRCVFKGEKKNNKIEKNLKKKRQLTWVEDCVPQTLFHQLQATVAWQVKL